MKLKLESYWLVRDDTDVYNGGQVWTQLQTETRQNGIRSRQVLEQKRTNLKLQAGIKTKTNTVKAELKKRLEKNRELSLARRH